MSQLTSGAALKTQLVMLVCLWKERDGNAHCSRSESSLELTTFLSPGSLMSSRLGNWAWMRGATVRMIYALYNNVVKKMFAMVLF